MPVGTSARPPRGASVDVGRGVEVEPGVAGVLRGREREAGIEPADRDAHRGVTRPTLGEIERDRPRAPACCTASSVVSWPYSGWSTINAHGTLRERGDLLGREREAQEVHRRGGVVAGQAFLVLVGRPAVDATAVGQRERDVELDADELAAATRAARRRR